MNSQTLQTQTLIPNEEKGYPSFGSQRSIYKRWASSAFPEEEIDIQEFLSRYQISFNLEIQNLKDQISASMDRITLQSQIIQDLQNRKIIPIQNLRSTKLHLKGPLYVVLEYEDGIFVISSDDLNLYGYGNIELNAIKDFCKEVEYLYFDLKQSKKLGKIMKENWEFLKNIIKEL